MGNLELKQEEEFETDEWALGDVAGQWLDGGRVAAARREEAQRVAKLNMFEPATRRRASRRSRPGGPT